MTSGARTRQQSLYDELWRHRGGEGGSPDRIRHRLWARYLRSPIVDVGAGDGLLARSFPSNDVYSLDLSGAGLTKVRRRAVRAAAEALPLRDGCVATVVLSEVLEHVEKPDGVLAECRRVLKPDGLLLMSVPLWPLSLTEAAHHRRRIGQAPTLDNLSLWDPNHERRFVRSALRELVEETGWDIVEEVPQFGVWASLGVYWVEPALARFTGRDRLVAHRLAHFDRGRGRSSGLSMILTPQVGSRATTCP